MKKLIPLLLLISFLLHSVGFAQNNGVATYYLTLNTDYLFHRYPYNSTDPNSPYFGCNYSVPHYKLSIHFQHKDIIIYDVDFPASGSTLTLKDNKIITFQYDDPPLSFVHTYTINSISGCTGISTYSYNQTNVDPITVTNCKSGRSSWAPGYFPPGIIASDGWVDWNLKADISNLLTPTTPANYILGVGQNNVISIRSITGYSSTSYNWQYNIDGNNWVSFPNGQGNSTLTGSLLDLIGPDINNYINHNISIRVSDCTGQNSNAITYEITPSPPGITIDTTRTTCSYNSDGKATLTLDRPLVAGTFPNGESLILTLIYTDPTLSPPNNKRTIGLPKPQIFSGDLTNINNNPYSYSIGNLSPGNYSLTIQEQYKDPTKSPPISVQGTPIIKTFTVTAPPPVSFTAVGNDVNCYNGIDGKINLTAKGGTGAFHYTITPATTSGSTGGGFNTDNTQTITNLSAGKYSIRVFDDNKCIVPGADSVVSVSIMQPSNSLQITLLSKSDPLAFGSKDGNITVNVRGGTPKTADSSYNFMLTDKSGIPITNNITTTANGGIFQIVMDKLPDGQYTLNVTDANYTAATGTNNGGCVALGNYTLTQPPPLKLSVEVKDAIKCSGDNNGSFIIHGSGGKPYPSGNPPYLYSWNLAGSTDSPKTQTESLVKGLSAGTYVLNIKDANGIALAPDSLFILGQPQLVEVQDSSHVDASCYGGYGSITTTIKGGTGNYYYKIGGINGGNLWKPFPNNSKKIVIDTLAGIYYIDIKDANNCQLNSVLSFTINSPSSALTIKKIIVTNPSGFGLSNGSITANITGGTPLTTGYYNVTVTNNNGNIIPSNNIKVISTNIDTVYQVTVNNLPYGTYTLTASDQNYAKVVAGNNGGCIAISAPVKLTQPPPLVAKIEVKSEVLCSGDATGTLVVHGTGGVRYPSGRAPYNYTWSQQDVNGSFQILNGKTDSLLTGLTAGTYSVNIQDLNGNVLAKDSLFTLNQPLPVHIDMAHTNVYCFGGADGTITLNASGGVGNYQYTIKLANSPDAVWIPFGSNGVQEINNLLAGNYQVSIRDGNQCLPKDANGAVITNFPITITQPVAPLLASLVNQTNPSAHGASDGSITLLVNGGTPKPGGTYNYSWTLLDGTPVTNNATAGVVSNGYQLGLTNIPDGTYVVTITDGNSSNAINNAGCIYVDTFRVVAPPPLMAKLSIKDGIYCNGDNGAILLANVTGGVPYKTGKPYNYVWKVKNNTGSYTILSTQTDSTATKLIAGYYALNVTDSKGVTLTQDSTIYISQPPLLEVSVTGRALTCSGVADANAVAVVTGGKPPYTYSWNTGDNTPTLSNLNAGTYLVVVKDANGCLAQQNIVITPPDAISVAVAKTNPSCNNSSDGQIIITPTGGNQPYTYKWLNSTNTNNFATNLAGGYYTVLVTDANGCSLTHTDTLKNPSILPLSIKPNRFICPNQSLMYDISINNPDITYQWTSDNGFSSSQPQVSLTQPGTYYAMVINKNGCFTKDTLVLTSGSGTISNDFLVPTQAFNNEPIVVVNTTNPAPDSVRWVLPSAAVISQQSTESVTFTIANPGSYDIKLITFSGQCSAEQIQKIFVSKPADLNSTGSTANPFITSFIVSPNPNSGTFRVQVKLQTQANIQLSLLNIATNAIQTIGKYTGTADYDIPLSYALGSGVYVLLLETPNGSRTFKIIVL